MKPAARTSSAERMGQTLGRLWRGCLRHERTVNSWLVAQGLPAGVAKVVSLLIKLVALGVLLYVAFWLALLLVFAVVAASVAGGKSPDEDEPEWRMGVSGYGLYRGDTRIDPGNPDDD